MFTSGCLDSFDGMSVFIAMTDAPLLYFIFQKIHSPNFLLDDFTFNLVNVDEHDIFHYIVSSEDFKMPVTILGIDTTKHCGPLSNIDLVQFEWEHFVRFSYKKYALVSHLVARLSFQNWCFWNIIVQKVTRGKTPQIVMIVSNVTWLFWIPFTHATFHPNALVKYVSVNLLPWQIPPDTFCSYCRKDTSTIRICCSFESSATG